VLQRQCRESAGLVDYSRQTREFAARFNEIGQEHGVFSSIETLEGWLIFSRLAREMADRLEKIRQEHRVFSSIETLAAFRCGKINPPVTRSAADKSTGPRSARLPTY
jgi:hypothetical protein